MNKLTAQALKDELNEKGCNKGVLQDYRIDKNEKDINAMGSKLDKVLGRLSWTIITNLITIIAGLVIFILTKKGG